MALTRKERMLRRFREMEERYRRTQAAFNGTTYTGNPDAVQQYRRQQVEKQIAEIFPLAIRLHKIGLIKL